LATNAAKHGALSSLSGRVAITWELKPGSLVLNWTEIGGPNVQSPAMRGFGIKVINSSIEAQLGGKAHFDWRRDGMHCTLTIPHGGEIEQTPSVSRVHWLAEDGEFPSRLPRGKQVMIVEDEALIGMMMKDTLTELGLTVNGPFSTLSGALRAAHGDDVDFAILDVNLAGEWVYPVADVLAARGIPFIFVTGYGADSVDCRFAQAQVFEKPIEPKVLETIFATRIQPAFHAGRRDARASVARG
jgi:CheY-like chemotaxis protein